MTGEIVEQLRRGIRADAYSYLHRAKLTFTFGQQASGKPGRGGQGGAQYKVSPWQRASPRYRLRSSLSNVQGSTPVAVLEKDEKAPSQL